MDSLLRFGTGSDVYYFEPDNQISFRDNFRNLVPQTTRLPGLDGGFDEFGSGVAPGSVGNVQVVFWVFGNGPVDMMNRLDDLSKMASAGVKRLYIRPQGYGENAERWCEARVNSIDKPMNARDINWEKQRVTMNFQVASPYWLSQGTEAPLWGGGSTWGGGVAWGGTATPHSVLGVENVINEVVTGNAITFPRITIKCGASQTATNVRIQRLSGATVIDEVRYDATLGNNDQLVINPRDFTVKLNGVDAYGSAFSFQNSAWFSLVGGVSNSIKVLMDNPSDACDVTFRYFERWR